MTLYEIDQRILDLVDPDTGELLDEEAFLALEMERSAKLENVALWIKDLTVEARAIKEEADILTDRRRGLERKIERLKGYLAEALGGEKFETARCVVSSRRAAALEVTDIAAAARWLEREGHKDMVSYGAPTVDKRSVKELVKAGAEVPGVELVERTSLTVR